MRHVIPVVLVLIVAASALAQQQRRPRERALPEGATVNRNLDYGGEKNPRQALDLYLPLRADKPAPVLVWIHGGAWRGGSKEGARGLEMINKGWAVASINYRLTGEAIWPAQIHDCKAAIRYLRAVAKDHHLDSSRIVVMGASAGGHLVAMLGATNGVKEMEGDVGKHLDQSSLVQGVIDLFGPTDFLQMQRQSPPNARGNHDAANSPESLLIGGPVQDNPEKARAANPITYLDRATPLPPFLILHGEADNTVPAGQSQLLHDAIQKLGGTSKLKLLKDAGHGGPAFQSAEVREMIADFLE